MIDPDEFLQEVRRSMLELSAAGKRPPLPPDIKAGILASHASPLPKPGTLVFSLAVHCYLHPLMCEKDEDGSWTFQLHPDPMNASDRAWCWLWPVRMGWRSWMFETFHGTTGHGYWQDYREKWDADPVFAARMECLCGETIIDVAAFSLDFTKCYGRLNEQSAVIGHPVYPHCAYDKPVRLFRTVRKWLDGKCAGAVLIGRDWENEEWMRGCDAGIITDDVAHGKYVQKILQRPYVGPKILVAG